MNYPSVFESEEQWKSFEQFADDTIGMDVSLIDGFIERVQRHANAQAVPFVLPPRKLHYAIAGIHIVEYIDGSTWIMGDPYWVHQVLKRLK